MRFLKIIHEPCDNGQARSMACQKDNGYIGVVIFNNYDFIIDEMKR